MNIYNNKKTLFFKLKNISKKYWSEYVEHDFLNKIVTGDLHIKKFQKYLLQDYIFLQQFLRILSLSCYKSKSNLDIEKSTNFITSIKHELKLHISFCKKWGISEKKLIKIKPLKANRAYTDYVLKVGKKGSILDIYTSLAPCIIGYGEIGFRLSKIKNWERSKYKSWIKTYSSRDYQLVARNNIEYLDSLFKNEKNNNLKKLSKLFNNATILEKRFWDMI